MGGSSRNSDPPAPVNDPTGSVGDGEAVGGSMDATGEVVPLIEPDDADTGRHHAIIGDRDSTGVGSDSLSELDVLAESEPWGAVDGGEKTGSVDASVDDPTGQSAIETGSGSSVDGSWERAGAIDVRQQEGLVPPTAPLNGVTGFEFQPESGSIPTVSPAASLPTPGDVLIEPPFQPAPPISEVEVPSVARRPSTASESSSSMHSDLNTMSGWIRGRLTVTSGVALGRTWYLTRGQLIVGRELECDVVLDDSSISQRHCRILRDETGHRVIDLGSLNGTYVNDRLVEEAELTDGDRLRVGESIFKYTRVGAVQTPQPNPSVKTMFLEGIESLGSTNQGLFFIGLAIFVSLMLSSAVVRGLQWAPSLDAATESEKWVKNARSAIEIRDWRRARDELAIAGALDPKAAGLDRLRGLVLLELDNALTLRLLERGAREDIGPDKLKQLLSEVEAESVYRFEAERLVELGTRRYVDFRLNAIGLALDRGDKKGAQRESDALEAQASTVSDIQKRVDELWKARRSQRMRKRTP